VQSSDIPVKIDIPFARDAGQFSNPIPDSPTGIAGRASWKLGFPPETMQPIDSGGTPPFGQDMNGVDNALSAWIRWQCDGGPVQYDATFQTNVGGYPLSALLQSADGLGWWLSQAENNMSDPDTGGANWQFVPGDASFNGNPNGNVSGHAATANSPPSVCWDTVNKLWWRSTGGTTWITIQSVNPVVLLSSTASHNYVSDDNGLVYVRSNDGSDMSDALPAMNNVINGWGITIYNGDATGSLTLTSTTAINGVSNASITLAPRQTIKLNADTTGAFWSTVPVVPRVFSGQAIYVNSSGTFAPGVYDIDTSGGSITFQLELGGAVGDNYFFRDVAGFFAANNLIVDPNGRTIEGQTGTMVFDVPWTQFLMTRNTDPNYSLV